jgi:hypothetical protein
MARGGHERRKKGRGSEREREGEGRGGEGKLTSGIQTPAPRGERGRGGRGRLIGRLLRGRNQMRERDQGEGARAWGRGARGARAGLGRAGPSCARLGHIANQNPRHAQPPIGIRLRTKIPNGARRTRD